MDVPRDPEPAVPGPNDGERPPDQPPMSEGATGDEPPIDERTSTDERESAYELLQRGLDLTRRRHHAQAAVVLERAARLEPGKGSILEPLGRASYYAGQHERAREVFEALLDVDPSSHYAHFVLGQSLRRLGRPEEARTHLRLAVALDPTNQVYAAALRRLSSTTAPPT
jgi:Flp pilus assembly protein TadD